MNQPLLMIENLSSRKLWSMAQSDNSLTTTLKLRVLQELKKRGYRASLQVGF